jgi:hypothetical protein
MKHNQVLEDLRTRACLAAAYYPELGLIVLHDFDFSELLSLRGCAYAEPANLENYALFAHEMTHFYQAIGTIYGADHLILTDGKYHASQMLLAMYGRYEDPKNDLGKHLPLIEFAERERQAIEGSGTPMADGLIMVQAPTGALDLLDYLLVTEGILAEFEGFPPFATQIPPNSSWEQTSCGDYRCVLSPAEHESPERVHLFFVPDCYRARPEPTVVSIGARAIMESWGALVEVVILGECDIHPHAHRNCAIRNKDDNPRLHDYYSVRSTWPRNKSASSYLISPSWREWATRS